LITGKTIICDIDGAVLDGNELIPGAETFLHGVMEHRHPLLLLTL
jgi:NagD protein